MFVIHHAASLIEDLPSAFPSLVAEIGVFQIERAKQLVEAAQLEKLSAIESAGAAAAIEAREGLSNRSVDAMAYPQAATLPPALRQPGFFAQLHWIAEKDLA